MEKKIHILFISSWYPNRQDPTHGIFNRYFAEAAALYNKVSVLHVRSDATLMKDLEFVPSVENNIQTLTVYYKKISGLKPIKKYNKVLAAYEEGYLRLVNQAGKPDLIQLNVVLPAGIGAMHLSIRHQIPYVINENWSGYTREDGSYKGPVKKYFTKKIVQRAKALMPTSTFLQKAMESHKLNGEYTVVPNVVNTKVFAPVNTTENKYTRFIHISSLNDREKNVSGIIKAFSAAVREKPELQLTIVGEGIDKLYYEELTHKSGLTGKIRFTGRLVSAALVKEINASDALLMFSNYETFCLVIIEGFACGKPVITSNVGAIPGYMENRLGTMVSKGDEKALSEAILRFASGETKYDSEFIRNFAVENFSYQTVGNRLTEIYRQALKN